MPTKMMPMTLKEKLWEAAQEEADRRRLSLPTLLSQALEDYLVDVRARCRLLKTRPPSSVERLAGILR